MFSLLYFFSVFSQVQSRGASPHPGAVAAGGGVLGGREDGGGPDQAGEGEGQLPGAEPHPQHPDI